MITYDEQKLTKSNGVTKVIWCQERERAIDRLGCDKEELSDFVKNWVKHAHYLRTRGFCLSTLFIWSILSATNKNEKHECTYCWKGCLGLLCTIHRVLLIGVYIGKKKESLL